MDLFARFKKDYFNYLISVILPAVISGLSIPLFKYLLGAKGYGRFSLWLNAALIISAVLYGWIAQSILRFYHEYKDKHTFSKQALFLSVRTQLIFFLPIFFVLYFTTHDLLLAFLFGILVFATSLQFTVMNLVQSSFLSRKIIASEAIRMTSYISIAVILLKFTPLPYLYSLLAAVIIAYFSAMMFLLSRRKIKVSNDPGKHESFAIPDLFKKLFRYGAPLSVWFVFAYLLSYVD